MEILVGGEIKDNDWLVIGNHEFFCDDLLDIAATKFLPTKKDFTSSELVKLVTAKVKDENGNNCRLKFTVCFELNDGIPYATMVGTSEWIKELAQEKGQVSKQIAID